MSNFTFCNSYQNNSFQMFENAYAVFNKWTYQKILPKNKKGDEFQYYAELGVLHDKTSHKQFTETSGPQSFILGRLRMQRWKLTEAASGRVL